jgi:hypothetical protein
VDITDHLVAYLQTRRVVTPSRRAG